MAKTTKPRTKADAPDDKDTVNRVRAGTTMTYDQAAAMLHDYGNAAARYTKARSRDVYPELGHGENYTSRENALATAEHYRGFKLGMEAVIAAMHGYDVRDRVIEEYDTKKKGKKA